MKKIFIISMFEGNEKTYKRFHFIGFYQGHRINKILVRGGEFQKNRAYVLALCCIEIRGEVLIGECVKSKELLN